MSKTSRVSDPVYKLILKTQSKLQDEFERNVGQAEALDFLLEETLLKIEEQPVAAPREEKTRDNPSLDQVIDEVAVVEEK